MSIRMRKTSNKVAAGDENFDVVVSPSSTDATTVNSELTLPAADSTTELSTVVGPLESV